MKKLNDFFDKKNSCYVIILCSLVISLMFEFLIGSSFFRTNNYTKVLKSDDFIVEKNKKSYNVIVSDVDKFINDIKLDITALHKTTFLTITSYNNKGDIVLKTKETFSAVQYRKPVFRVGKKIDRFKITFSNIKNLDISINSIKLSGKYVFNFIRFLVLFIICYLILDFIRYTRSDKRENLYIFFLKVSMLLTCLCAIINPIYNIKDEKEHMVRSYNISMFNFNLRDGEKVKWPSALNDFIELPGAVYTPTTYKGFKDHIKYLEDKSKSKKVEVYHQSNAEPYLFFGYLISGIGMFLGNIFGLSFVFQFYLGRLFNAIVCSLILCYAIKVSGKYNKLIFALSFVPLVLFQNSSFSADALTNSFGILSIALTLGFRESNDKMNYKKMFLLLISYIMSFVSKIAYFPICLLMLLIPKDRFSNKKQEIIMKCFVIFICLLVFIIGAKYAFDINVVQWAFAGVDSTKQIHNMVKYPFIFPISIINTFYKGIFSSFRDVVLIGYDSLGDYGLLLVIIELIIVVFSIKKVRKITILEKTLLLFYIVITICAVAGTMYLSFTKVGSLFIYGLQGRYIFQIIAPLLLLFVTDKVSLNYDDRKTENFVVAVSLLLNISSFIFLICKFYY